MERVRHSFIMCFQENDKRIYKKKSLAKMVDELPPKIDGEEILYRVIRRLPDELPPHPNALKQPDLKEVIRNTNYRGSGKPESGMSFLRARYFKTRQEVFDKS